jgi:sarcosine oxidase subunit alpha
MFRRLPDVAAASVTLTVDGQRVGARVGDSVAAALLAHGSNPYRTTAISGEPRAPYCMMGVCFDCLVTADGIANRQACLVPVRDGMVVLTQHGKREVDR